MFEKLRFDACTMIAGKLIRLADISIDEAQRLQQKRNIYSYDEAACKARSSLTTEITERTEK